MINPYYQYLLEKPSGIEEGYRYCLDQSTFFIASDSVIQMSGAYLKNIDSKIDLLQRIILEKANDNPSNHGYLAEYWHAYTYNISSAVLRTASWAKVLDSPEDRAKLGGADILTSFGQELGSKYCKTPYDTAMAQAKTIKQRFNAYHSKHPEVTLEEYLESNNLDKDVDINRSIYDGQARLAPSDQIPDMIKALNKRIDHDMFSGSEQQAKDIASLIETRDALVDHISGPNGEHSFPLTFEQAKALQRCAKNGTFDPARFDIEAARLADKAFLVTNAVNAGLNAAWTSLMLKLAPEIVNVLTKAVKGGIITSEDLANLGKAGASGFATGFIRGTFVAAITSAAEIGYLTDAMQKAALDSSFASGIAVLVTTAMNISRDAAALARGTISRQEFAYRAEKAVVVASAGYICGCAVQSLLLEFPTIGYMLGNFIGSILGGFAFDIKERIFISACVENNWTFFGLVDQDYTLPPEVEARFGFDRLAYDTITYDVLHYDKMIYDKMHYDLIHYDRIDMHFVKRGVIGIRKVGYQVI